MTKFWSKTVLTHSKWANEQTLKTELPILIMHAQIGEKVYVTLFLVFVRLPIYGVYTHFLNKILSFLSFGYPLTCTVSLHPFTEIPVRNDYPSLFSICIRDII